jgi:hypothetical protein
MKFRNGLLGIVFIALFFSCKDDWNEHYNSVVETIDTNVWDAIQNDSNLSMYVQYMKEFEYDTLFLTDQTYTLFIPDNNAFIQFTDTGSVTLAVLSYHISTFYIQSVDIQGKRKIQTFGEKFAFFERTIDETLFDDISVDFESPLYLNGKYFIINKVALPKPNLYEYYAANNPILKKYIDSQDSIILDKELSRPLGFDENGNTIYDTVSIIYNIFEAEYFPVSEESRYKTATIVFPKEEDYHKALTDMADSLGQYFTDYNDIPLDWQYKILIPYLLEHGVFENMLEEDEFVPKPGKDTLKLKNILGDSIVIDYHPVEKALCSNGYAYNYDHFKIPDTLYNTAYRMEGEWLLRTIGINRYAWNEDVSVSSDISFEPIQELVPTASNDSILKVNFPNKYAGNFSVEFNVDYLFPRKFLMVVRTYTNIGGKYEIYMNDELVKTIDYYDYIRYRGVYPSVISGKRYISTAAGYSFFDCWIENLTEYSHAKLRFEYTGFSSTVPYSGLTIDYIEFIPY